MWLSILAQIFEVVIIPLLGWLTIYIIKLISSKIQVIKTTRNNELEKKYLDMLDKTITSCVIATTQTYVDSLKKQGKFDLEAQQKAFETTYNAVCGILTEEAKTILTSAIGDLNLYITQAIEAEVKNSKKSE